MKSSEFRRLIRQTLQRMQSRFYSPAAENLLFGTAAHESGGFQYLWQVNGPARGLFQMEPTTLDDLYTHYLGHKPGLHHVLEGLRPPALKRDEALTGCLAYAIGAARLQYYRFPDPLPNADDIQGLAAYYKVHWNTELGKATEQDFIDAYERHAE